ncbi:Fibropellin-1 [Holothuria leucospilota]|uniref:Fibropellin-1 n=1 Tax=Holothuria leucospilota TaxID=206669 RepID=A0A9Q1CLZ3_HOLLE|nr:Fibropellin-1 [Holothuria leucospilota]
MMGGVVTWISLLVLLTISFGLQFCNGFSNFSNANSEQIAYICDKLVANHSEAAQGVTVEDTFPVTLHVGTSKYTPGTTKNITVSIRHATDSNSEKTLKGFIIQARKVSSLDTPEGIGTWLPNEDAVVLQCGENSTAIVQRDGSVEKRVPITVMFNAPPTDVGSIVFVASWVEDLSTHMQSKFYSTALSPGTPCEDTPCLNGGQCKEDDNDPYGRKHNCTCGSGTKGLNCEELVCEPNPCGLNQLCHLDVYDEDPDELYLCKCDKPGYSGENCTVGPCSVNECLNGGTCYESNIEVDGNYYSCSCPQYVSGTKCENTEPCANNPCNTGLCIQDSALPGGFTCDCSSVPYTGVFCQTSECFLDEKLGGCKNGGTCYKDSTQTARCYCPLGYVHNDCGSHVCELESGPCTPTNKQCVKDPAAAAGYVCNCTILFTNYPQCDVSSGIPGTCEPDNPCLNGGTCTTVTPTSLHPLPFDCSCTTGYKGEICEIEKTRCEIAGFPCMSGGVCNNNMTEPLCTCPYGYNGTYCQDDVAPPELGCEDIIIPGNGSYEYQFNKLDEFGISVTDNSNGYFLRFTPSPPLTVPVGATYITVLALDLSANFVECSFKVVLTDTIPPDLTCPHDSIYTSMPGDLEAYILLPDATASDNYGNVTLTTESILNNTEAVPLGVYNITVIAEDDDRNNNSCYYSIQVEYPQLLYVVFSVNDTFVDSYSNASSPEYGAFSLTVQESMETEMSVTSFADAYSGFLVTNLGPGSVNVSGVLMMNSNTNLSDPNTVQNLTIAMNESVTATGKLGNLIIIAGSFGMSDDVCLLSPCLNGGVCLGGEINNVSCDCSNTGYEGQICDEKIDYCSNNPCQNGGICTSGSLSFSCDCSVDYTGDTCQTMVDHCAGSPCNNEGTCTSGSNATYTCTCTVDYTGDNCETQVDHCANAPCQNEGTCTSETNGVYTCECTVDYTGDNCEQAVDHCDGDPCINGGSCTSGTQGTFTCSCTAGFTGDTCDTAVDLCADSPCQNGGSCESGANGYTCNCTADFIGENCTDVVDHCTTRMPCENGGTCNMNQGGGYTCACTVDFTGANCESAVNHCDSGPCLNGADCTSQSNGQFICNCAAGFTGTTCADVDPCSPNQCQNSGTCVPIEDSFQCLCVEGFSGAMCQTIDNPCNPNPCQNDGTCVTGQGMFSCLCATGFQGETCTDLPCDSSPCQNNGTCDNVGGGFSCTCTTGFIGDTCSDDDSCEPNPCQNGGICTVDGSGYVCNCTGTNYTGTECQTEVDLCNPNPCLNDGICGGTSTVWICTCPDGFTGDKCQNEVVTPCSSEPCQNGGTCEIDGESYNCSCATGWEGSDCEIDSQPCDPNPCENNNTCLVMSEPGQYNCSCGEKWTGKHCEIDLTPCDSSPCKYNGTCQNLGGGDFNCTCDEVDWTGPLCGIDVTPCDPLPCMNGGNCTRLGPGNFSCMCEENEWTGDVCEIDLTPCDPLPCDNNGTCTVGTEAGVYTCSCTEKWGGQDCNIYLLPCELSPCQNNGLCQNGTEPGDYNCNCAGYWEGKNCATLATECTTNPCQNDGTCSPGSDGFSMICQCTSEYEGNRCQTQKDPVDECESDPCQNGGICTNLINRYLCNCDDRYEGKNCETDTLDNSAQTASASSWWIIALCICFLIIIGIAAVFVCVSMSKKSSS